MRAVLQRVDQASVTIEGTRVAQIGSGLLVFLGIEPGDNSDDIQWLSAKMVRLRIFNDDEGVMNRSIIEHGGDILLVSQFTLMASTKKGNRPSYSGAAPPTIAIPIYEAFIRQIGADLGKPVQTGQFGADMQVALLNNGPVTLCIDSKHRE
jgi:D-aminoacyl-tRNA deacylase